MLNSFSMTGNYFITGIRAVLRHKTHLALNLLGLTTGLASALLILLYASYELGYDQMHPNAENSYRLEQFFLPVNQRFPVSSPAMKALLENYDQGIKVTRINSGADTLRLAGSSQQLSLKKAQAVDANITDFFQIEVLQGDLTAALTQPNQIALSEQEALRLFGQTSVLGQQFQLGEQRYTISALYRMPEQSHFQAGSLRRISD